MTKRDGDPDDLQVQKLRKEIDQELLYKIWVILSGNGNPEHGIMWKVSQLMSFKDSTEKAINKIVWSAVIGTSSVVALFLWTVLKDQILRGKL